MKKKPTVSVIIPVFNAGKYLTPALSSVFGQTYQNLEIICINDASTDNSLEILKNFGTRLKLLENDKNCGIGETRNRGIALATGDFLAFMDADDIWEVAKLESQLGQFQANPDLDISFSHMKCFISPELPMEIKTRRYCPPESPGYISGTALIKMASFKKVGPFNPKWKVGEFVDWLARAKELGLKEAIVPGVFLLRRIHETNTGVTARSNRADYLRIIKESLDRKKAK